MIRGIYAAAAGMNVQKAALDAISNNIANINVPGYKKKRLTARPFPELLLLGSRPAQGRTAVPTGKDVLGLTYQGVAVRQVLTDFAPGPLRETGSITDFALRGEGFFTLAKPDGEEKVAYTRNGSFRLDSEGNLVNHLGYQVMGHKGPVQIKDRENFQVDENGNIYESGRITNKLLVVSFADPGALQRTGNDLYLAGEQQPEPLENPGLVQRFLEGANVDPVEETVNMVTAARAYETGQKIIQAQDGLLDLAINKVGILR